MSTLPAPRYSVWQAVSAALAAALRALEEVRALSREPGPQGERGERGERGADGFGFDDLDVVYDGARTFTFRFTKGDAVKEFPLSVPAIIDRGVYKAGDPYEAGDAVSWAGALWIAQAETTAKPGDGGDGWRLAVKSGRHGKDGKDGAEGPRGPQGIPGRDGRAL